MALSAYYYRSLIDGILTKYTLDSYIDKLHLRMLLTIEPISQGVIQLINNGVKSRTITEITEENIFHVKKLIKIVKDRDGFRDSIM